MRVTIRPVVLPIALLLSGVAVAEARDLSFEDRVKAQEAIERVYYAHQSDATRPFEQAVPRTILESKVRTYLRQSAALEQIWRTPLTADMLRLEGERIAASSRMPERLQELYGALGNDPFLVQECLVRPALVDRLARERLAADASIQGDARRRAEQLREMLSSGRINPYARREGRYELTLTRVEPGDPVVRPGRLGGSRAERERFMTHRDLSPAEFDGWAARIPARTGEIGTVTETGKGFLVRVTLEKSTKELRFATFSVPKRTWSDWWPEASESLDETLVRPAATERAGLPKPHDLTCNAGDAWTYIEPIGEAPSARQSHTAVWTGTYMIVWGGSLYEGDIITYLGDGSRYDPVLNQWFPMSTSGAPTARDFHTAVWTGSVMIVWGGGDTVADVRTGGRYDPIGDTWLTTNVTGSPTARSLQAAVWTGSVMVVWGGSSFNQTGARYNPNTNTWAAMTTTGAPSARIFFTGVWAGDRLVVWGGSNISDTKTQTGGRYNPVTNIWNATTLTNAPEARIFHSMVWTGSQVIVWGGEGDVTGLQDSGSLYDPVGDSWSGMSATDAPAARESHTAVWVNGAMYVWGGSDEPTSSQVVFDTGGRYDPAADAWSATTTTNVPPARWLHSAVAAGDVMLVWGGSDLQFDLADGASYCTCSPVTYYRDADGDGFGDPAVTIAACGVPAGYVTDATDCNDADGTAWATPSEALGLVFTSQQTLSWQPPAVLGGSVVTYDVLRSTDRTSYGAAAACAASDLFGTSLDDTEIPPQTLGFFYLIRAQTACGAVSEGPLGNASDGTPRSGRACP